MRSQNSSKLIVIQLGSGTLQTGFPLITAQLWERPDDLPQQFTGLLPAAPELERLSQSWQALYRALCSYPPTTEPNLRKSSQPRMVENTPESDFEPEFEIDNGGIQQVSSYEFEELCQSLSDQLNRWLCSVEFSSIDRPLRSHLSVQDPIRIILTTQADQIRRLPWQRWDLLQDFPQAELALSLTQYRRQSQAYAARSQPRILAILGNSQNIDLVQEKQLLDQMEQAEVKFLIEPSREQVHQALWDSVGWDLLFFAGHSSSESSTVGRLYLNHQDNPKHNSLTIDEFSEALSAAVNTGLKLAIFNSCDGLGLANQLAALNIPQVIVMREPVPNRVAQTFFQAFLTAYVHQSLPLYIAIKQARRQLQALEADFPGASWLPILCQNPAEVPLDWQDLCQPEPFESPNSPSLPRQDLRDRQIFLNKVRNAWIKGVLQKALPAQAMLNMGLREHPNLLQTPTLEAVDEHGYPLPPGTYLIDYFDALGMGRSLLLLGEPGAGKTIALLDIAQTLIQRAEQEVSYPLPVVLNLSDWGRSNPRKKILSIRDWLQQSLLRYYQVPHAKTEAWLQTGQLTLLFDGLDEVPTEMQSLCIEAINQFHQDYAQVEMMVCCRYAVYQAINAKLALQVALVLEPLSLDGIYHYCQTLGPMGQKAQALLERDRLLRDLAASPLMLNIILLAIDDMEVPTQTLMTGPQDLSTERQPKNLEELRHRLLNTYINRMLSRRTHNAPTPAATISGLRFLAQKLQHSGQSVFQLEAIQPDWLPNPSRQVQYPILLGITLMTILSAIPTVVGLWLGGTWVALAIWLSWSLLGGSISGFIGGWLGGLTGGLIGGSLSTILLWILIPRFSMGLIVTPILAIFMSFLFGFCRARIEPVERFGWSWQRAGKWLLIGLGVGALLSLPLLFASTTEGRVMTPIVALLFMLFQGFSKRSHLVSSKARPNEGIWRSAQNAIQISLLSTVIFGALSCLILSLNTSGDWASFRPSLQASLPFGAIAGGIMGTGMGLIGAEGSGVICIQHVVVRLMLWRQAQIPWNYAKFLDGCVNQILLRKVGGNYIFLHRILLEHFANWRPSP